MAEYAANAMLFIGDRLIMPGETFESDLVPGKNWEPVDAAAKAAFEKRFGAKALQPAPVAATAPATEPKAGEATDGIPADWRTRKPFYIINLARRLGGGAKNMKLDDAKEMIERHLALTA